MADKYKDYLAARIFSEQKPVTYRLLSRAVQCKVNIAKQMLAEFYKTQNAKKPNSVHCTYIVTGISRDHRHTNGANGQHAGDTAMRSSPPMSSMPQAAGEGGPDEEESSDTDSDDESTQVKETAILLVSEEDLKETRASLQEVHSVHIYSLQPGPLVDLQVLHTCSQEMKKDYPDEDPLQRWKIYGSIRNPHMKRRAPRAGPPTAASKPKPAAKPATKPAAQPAAKPTTKPVGKLVAKEKEASASAQKGSASEDDASGRSTPQPSAAPSTLKRTDSKPGANKNKSAGDIFKSFAKAKAKPKEADKSNESTPAPVEDEPMQGMSEDEGDADEEPAVKVDEEKNEAARKAREDRAERLRKMMEDDDEEMPDAPAATDSQSAATPTAAADTPEPVEGEPIVTVENGRRRGRRRVMKKKKVKDEDGYLVTKEEAVWESFSEEEPQSKKIKPTPKPASSAKGKNAPKKGQGSIASFFKKA